MGYTPPPQIKFPPYDYAADDANHPTKEQAAYFKKKDVADTTAVSKKMGSKRYMLQVMKTRDAEYDAKRAKKKSDYANSTKGIFKNTVKGLPSAAKKVGRYMLKRI